MIAIIDYGAGNLFSVSNALNYIGAPNIITKDVKDIEKADALILPGVGAFPDAMAKLHASGLVDGALDAVKVKPLLGICLGMQMLFDESYEFSKTSGLSLISGEVKQIKDTGLKIPHMGWNSLKFKNPSPLLEGIDEGSYFYFVHSFMAYCDEKNLVAVCDYGCEVPALVQNGNVFGAQFHPEKSGDVGLLMLKNFWRLSK
ncbi:MAG: imidazole glycerol phosphate synthase subunit HisH [Oscillospiraceae bacterium]|nr:imidazole glycerol phosphate synthase subunit HisH [Oscillospiraceae bacterium]